MPKRDIPVLSVSDRVENQLFKSHTIDKLKDIELIISCGDLPYYYIEKLIQTYQVPALFVRGNHDHAIEYQKNGPQSGPFGAIDLHNRVVVLNNLIFLGFEGSLRYREGPFMYSQSEMWLNVIRLIPQLLANKLTYGRFVDVLITHSPPWNIHDQPTHIHRGFKAFHWLLKTFKPVYMYHGHIHLYTEDQRKETIFEKTKVINTFGSRKSVIRAGKQHYMPVEDESFALNIFRNPAEDFRNARRKAAIENIWNTLTGSSQHLIQFQQIEDQLNYDNIENIGLKEIPLDAIVASINRHNDFTRKFFPLENVDPQRWQRVYKAYSQQMLPIEVYQIDEVYFVLDGNHRVSIARQRGQKQILANVTKIESLIPLTPEDNFEDIIIKNQLVQFLNETKLNELRPELDFTVSTAGLYRQLREQISNHHLKLELEHHYPYTFQEAVLSWADEVYLPVVQSIIQHGLLRDFPERSPTDLYLWLVNFQQEISHLYGWQIKPHGVIEELAKRHSRRFNRRWQRLKNRFRPNPISESQVIGNWRETHLFPHSEGKIFSAILVAISGQESGWQAFEQALKIAELEKSTINGLHIVKHEIDTADPHYKVLRKEFRQRSKPESITTNLVIEKGEVVPLLSTRAQWNDLVVFSLEYPPEDKPLSRLKSSIRHLIQTCPRPLLAVPAPSPLRHALVAYDGSRKSNEALFLGAYLKEQWNIQLTVVSALEDSSTKFSPINQSRNYLESRQLQANFVEEVGSPPQVILNTMKKYECDFLLVGGYGYKPVIEVILGSTLDALLRLSDRPILICH